MAPRTNNIQKLFSVFVLALVAFGLLGVMLSETVVEAAKADQDTGPYCGPFFGRKKAVCQRRMEECKLEGVYLKWGGTGCKGKCAI